MVSAHGLLMFFWQTPYDGSAHDIHLIMFAQWVIVGLMIVLFLAAFVAAIVAFRVMKRVERLIDDAQAQCSPILSKTNQLIDDIGPKVRSITTNVEQISFTARDKVDELGVTVSELNKTVNELNVKARVQANRVDGIVTEALATTQQVSHTIQNGIRGPVNKIAAVVAGLKVGIERLVESSPLTSRFRTQQPKAPQRPPVRPGVPPYDL